MSATKMRTLGSWAFALLPVFMVIGMATADAAGATSTGIAQLDGAQKTLIAFVKGLSIFACIFLIGILVWDFVQHRNISRSIFEFLGVIILGVIAFNADTVAQAFQSAGAGL